MSVTTITKAVKHRRDTEALWISNNPILLAGQLAFSTDVFYGTTNFQKFKVGNGVSSWTDLDYFDSDTARSRKIFAYQNTDSSITGTLAERILFNKLIPANSMGLNDTIWWESSVYKIGASGTASFKKYFNTSPNTLVGAKTFGVLTIAANVMTNFFTRHLSNKNSQTVNNCYPVTQTAASELSVSALARTAINVDWTVDQYLIETCTLGNINDEAGFDNIQIYINKP